MEMASLTGELLTFSSREIEEILRRCPGMYFRSMMCLDDVIDLLANGHFFIFFPCFQLFASFSLF